MKEKYYSNNEAGILPFKLVLTSKQIFIEHQKDLNIPEVRLALIGGLMSYDLDENRASAIVNKYVDFVADIKEIIEG